MKTNIKGDSGLSDSGFYSCQRFIQRKHQKDSEFLEESSRLDLMKKRFDSVAKPPQNKSLWNKIKSFFGK
tara:strand:+ start:2138 stop:2347 length:210 start_codon:yes stop_codon:yes gene_type:complete